MNEAKPKEEIRERIIEIRGKKVMLVNDIAKILKYANGAKDLNKIIKRNIKKFPEDSYFILNKEETENMHSRCQNGTLNKSKNGRGNNLKYLPYVLSVEGLTVLSRVLKTDKSRVIYEEILPFFSSEDRCKIISKTSEIQERNIQNLIFEVRGKQVILDSDLASLYECTNGTKDINKAVKRNLNRFPEDFYFQLTKEELLNLKFQFGTSSWNEYGGLRKLPHVFTEQGVAMISSLLNSDKAAQISITIMWAFVICVII